ncbi:acyltransferase [Microbacterium sp. NPDC058345]|uniref:acyltransferase family protein n=1 Tax=Microbacterium sp. NPDC058345 TaxID=3346455 RepID=UPI00366498A2
MTTLTPARDRAVDLVRALCIAGVVILHALMVGVTIGPDGPVFANAGETGTWLVPVSWVLQVMPLFFVIGGFSGLTALRAARRRGENGADFAAARVRRLLLPAVAAVGSAGVLLAVLGDAGLDPQIIGIAAHRFGQPLWFLGVFLLCQTLLPVMVRLHERAPVHTVAALAGIALTVEVVRAVTGTAGIGFLNLLFVWLAMQQLGFLLADGWIDRLSRRTRLAAAAASLGLLGASFALGFHSPDLIANINPPTTALILVGVVHTCAFSLLRGRLRDAAARRVPALFTRFVTARAMTIYLWHMPVLLTLAGLSALVAMGTGMVLPAPASPEWWLTRPLWVIVALAATALLSVPLARLESLRSPAAVVTGGAVAAASTAGIAGVVLLLVVGTSPTTAIVAVSAWLFALRIVTPAARPVALAAPGVPPTPVQPRYSA